MSEDLRKRLKYLQHLPVSCEFEVVEIGMDAPTISPVIMAKFHEELKQRQKNRHRRAREELKREKQIELVNERQIGKIIRASANIDVTSEQQFPLYCGTLDDPPLRTSSSYNFDALISPDTASGSSGPSFATMLTSRKTGNNTELWPSLEPTKDLSFASAASTSKAGASSDATTAISLDSDEDDDVCHEYARPAANDNFGSVIAEALIHNSSINKNVAGGKGKKKKGRNTVLFSMGGRTFDGN